MNTTLDHYATLLAPVYLWMSGGLEAALAQGTADVAAFSPAAGPSRLAVDLGAGFGMHAIPLARAGYRVLAVDSSPLLLDALRQQAGGLPIEARQADLLSFREFLSDPADLVLCMGDTLTHLQDHAEVDRLVADVRAALAPQGRFIATFRDYRELPRGEARFIPVRSDAQRIQTCFIEDAGDSTHLVVHDLLHERDGDAWRQRVSSYRKLRLAPEHLLASLASQGLVADIERGPRGLVRVVTRPAGSPDT
jgi:SAM-dependent methyltransferase